MAAIVGTIERSVELSGTSCSVPAGDLPAISYYMSCLNSLLVEYNISREIIDFRNARYLRNDQQNALIALCVLFNPMEVINKLIIVDDDYEILPRGNSNKFCNLSEVTRVVAVASDTLVGGQQTKITKVMLCTTEWVEKYWVRPMRNLKRQVAAVAHMTWKETDEYLAAVELKLQLNRLQDLMGQLDVSSSSTPTTKHCGHCKGLGAACACKEGCPRNGDSECMDHPTVTCDRCKDTGLRGPRFKCRDCYDYDLCSQCYQAEVDDHVRHSFLRITRHDEDGTYVSPRRVQQCDHPTVTCDVCKTDGFNGARFQCRECYNYNLCHKCYQIESDAHLQCRFWLIPKEGDSKIDMPPRVRKPTPSTDPTPPCTPPKHQQQKSSRFQKGQKVVYDKSSSVAEIIHVHFDDQSDPYYTIAVDGRELQTTDSHLRDAADETTQNTPAKPIYTPSSDPPVVEAYPINPDYDPFAQGGANTSTPPPAPTPRPAPTPPVVQVDNFSQGQTVRLSGLTDPSTNGKTGVVEKMVPGGKYVVVIPDVGKKIVQAQNMEIVVDDPKYRLNACVELTGLANTQENGKYGVIVGHHLDRVLVKLFDEERTLKVRKENVVVIDEAD